MKKALLDLIYKKGLILILLLLFLGITPRAGATHVMGAEVTYENIDSLKFKVYFKYYRYCNGVAFSNPSSATRVRCLTGSNASVTLTLESIREVTYLCDTVSGGCSPANTYGTGDGVEEHTYYAIIDFGDSNSSYYSMRNCCNVIFETGQCCRNGAINTGAANQNFYTYAKIDLCNAPTNSSPSFSDAPYAQICCNQPVFNSFGIVDTTDHDSISYSWGHPLSGYGSNVSYSGTNYAYNHPFQAYYPGTVTPPYTNPNTNPPIGIFLDNETGDMIYTPTRCDEVTVAVIEVKEWRKDSTGAYQQIGMIRRDMQYITSTCADNNPPKLSGPYSYSVCEGETLCFNISSTDQQFIPPPPASAHPVDTTQLFWNEGIRGATFTINDTTVREKSATFCWTPPVGAASNLPYRFVATTVDDNCPVMAKASRTYSVKVKKKAFGSSTIDTLGCGSYAIHGVIDSSTLQGNGYINWDVFDTTGARVSLEDAYFNSTQVPISLAMSDTLNINRSGLYVIRMSLRVNPQNCYTYYYDTLELASKLDTRIDKNDSTYCVGEAIDLNSSVMNNSGAYTYSWEQNGQLLSDTTSGISIDLAVVDKHDTIRLSVTDSLGCTAFDEVILSTYARVIPSLDELYASCDNDVVVMLPGHASNISWSDQSTDTILTISTSGDYHVMYEDSLGCGYTDSFEVRIDPLPINVLGNDTSVCSSYVLNIVSYDSVVWDNGSTQTQRTIDQTGQYTIVVYAGTCAAYDTLSVQVNVVPDVQLRDTFGCDSVQLTANTTGSNLVYLWSSGDTSGSAVIHSSGQLSVIVTDQNGCSSSDSAWVIVATTPQVTLIGDSVKLCADSISIDLSNLPYDFLWSTGDTTGSIVIDTSGTYWLKVSDTMGCSSADTTHLTLAGKPMIPQITRVGDSLYSNITGYHLWYRNDTLLSDTGNVIAINVIGVYKARSRNAGGCESGTSNSISKTAGVDDLKRQFYIAPNPTNGLLIIRYTGPGPLEDMKIGLFTIDGRSVPVTLNIDGNTITLEWDDMPTQILWLRINGPLGSLNEQILEQ